MVILGVLSFLTFLPELTQFSASTLMSFFQDDVVAQVIDAKLLLPQVLVVAVVVVVGVTNGKGNGNMSVRRPSLRYSDDLTQLVRRSTQLQFE